MNPLFEREGRRPGFAPHAHAPHVPGSRPHHPRADRFAFGNPGRGGPLHPPHGGGRPGGRRPRGDVRTAVLLLLADAPMHGYQLMQAIAERSGGRWTPSPGAIYPTISQLEDEGLVTVTAEAGRKLVTLTDSGHEHVASRRGGWADPMAGPSGADDGVDLRGLLEQVHSATRQVGRSGTEAQRRAAAELLTETRRALYLLLADAPEAPGSPDGPGSPEAPGSPTTT